MQNARACSIVAGVHVAIVVATGCARKGPNPEPSPKGAARSPQQTARPETSHFLDDARRPLPEYEWIWKRLGETYGETMPEPVVVNFDDGDGGYFDPTGNEVHLSKALFAKGPALLLAHETSHLCLAVLTHGASAEEAFRFLDEGFAEIVSHQIAGGLDEYKQGQALPEARIQQSKGNVTFEKVQAWSSYFGNWRGAPVRANGSSYAHAVGASFDFMVMDRYGQATLLELFRSVGRTRSLEESTEAVLHKSLTELQEEWLAYLAAVPLPVAPRITGFFPEAGATAVPTELSELRVVFDVPMTERIAISSSCEPDVSYRNAYWKDPRTLAIRLPDGLRPGRSCHLRLGAEHFRFQSRSGAEMPVVDWTFATR